jgi:hypothetical protein
MVSKKFGVMVGALLLTGLASGANDASTFTLYRNSVLDAKMRLHVASFDTANGAAYNKENCAVAQQLFLSQPGIKTQFWCEPGRFHWRADHARRGLATAGYVEPSARRRPPVCWFS